MAEPWLRNATTRLSGAPFSGKSADTICRSPTISVSDKPTHRPPLLRSDHARHRGRPGVVPPGRPAATGQSWRGRSRRRRAAGRAPHVKHPAPPAAPQSDRPEIGRSRSDEANPATRPLQRQASPTLAHGGSRRLGRGQDQHRADGPNRLQFRQRVGPAVSAARIRSGASTAQDNRHPASKFRCGSMDQPKAASGDRPGSGISRHRATCRSVPTGTRGSDSLKNFGT